MKRILNFATFVFLGLASTFAFGQQVGDLQGTDPNDRVVRGETRLVSDETGPLIEYDRQSNCTTVTGENGQVQRIKGKLKKVRLDADTIVENYDMRTGKPHHQCLKAGTQVWVDENGTLICKASCRNPLSTSVPVVSNTKQVNTTVFMQRERTRRYETDVHHFHTEYVPVPEYHLVRVYAPSNQSIGVLGAPNISSPTVGGINASFGGGTSINNSTCVTVSSKNINSNRNNNNNKNENNNKNKNENNNTNGNTVNLGKPNGG